MQPLNSEPADAPLETSDASPRSLRQLLQMGAVFAALIFAAALTMTAALAQEPELQVVYDEASSAAGETTDSPFSSIRTIKPSPSRG